MVSIGNAAAELCVRLATTPEPTAAPGLAAALVAELAAATDAIARQARPLLRGIGLTHSFSGTVLAALRAARPAATIVTEARPLCEGRALAAALAATGIPTTLITDAQAARFAAEAAFVVLGADALLPDGSFVNKVGSALVALAAREADRPLYIACDLLKACAASPHYEEDPPGQVWRQPPTGVAVRNVAFERVPAHLVTAYITPDGPVAPPALGALVAERVARWSWLR
jgi:translation initiation factor 2B subunit (eIF-2B alpha/beta/delta family)